MSKTSKELAVEIICAYIQSTGGLRTEDLPRILQMVYNAIQDLEE